MAIVLTAASAAGVVVASLRTLDTKSVASEVFAVELLNHGISDFLVVDVGEAETATGTGFAVENSLEANSLPDAGELSFKLFALKILRQIADVKTHAHETGKEKERLRVRPIVVVAAKAVNHRTHSRRSKPSDGTARIALRGAPARGWIDDHTRAQGSDV